MRDLWVMHSSEFIFKIIVAYVGTASFRFHTTKSTSKKFHSQILPSTPQNFQPVLSTVPSSVPPPSHNLSTSRPYPASPIRPSPIQHPRPSPILTSQQLQPVSRTSRRREDWSPLPFPASQVFQRREHWPIRVTREDQNCEPLRYDHISKKVTKQLYKNYFNKKN
ncbi:hypothetical protein O181_004809 [Austropuccinia psidii MF-1]|uniref:Uncharacterized protein n=1 Tax=Austropuccinia psidii MF-1 TaxID=1389203 RepID=A0A9Q3BGZ1_9BASI|nr:hypothetical protein [Austropuccinia psidii MF-1]